MELTFEKISLCTRGTLLKQLVDGYSMDENWKIKYEKDWIEYDDFFFDNLDIADTCGFVTLLNGELIGHISWDPRNRPDYIEIGHNCIIRKYKGNGYGKLQLQEAINRIKQYEGLEKIIVTTNSNLVAPYNYESAGFQLYQRRKSENDSSFTGDYLDYQMFL